MSAMCLSRSHCWLVSALIKRGPIYARVHEFWMKYSSSNQLAVSCMLMRGGTSKAAFFEANDLPRNDSERDALILAAMGFPDVRQIDGIGGGTSLTTKVAIVKLSERENCDVDYLFGQVVPDESRIDYSPTCGNILAAVGPYAIERGLIDAKDGETRVRIHMCNTGARCVATVRSTRRHGVCYEGEARISGVPGTSAPIYLTFDNTVGATCGSLFPTGNRRDIFAGTEVTCIDNGMPVVLVRAGDVGITGYESPAELDANIALKQRIEDIRRQAGVAMGLGDVTQQVIPKVTLIAAPCDGGSIATRTFIPRKCHDAIGVLGAVSVASAMLYADTVTHGVAEIIDEGSNVDVSIEHPSGDFGVRLGRDSQTGALVHAAIMRTARALFRGDVMIPSSCAVDAPCNVAGEGCDASQ
jgi:4-oxalomesaconate tautomerase